MKANYSYTTAYVMVCNSLPVGDTLALSLLDTGIEVRLEVGSGLEGVASGISSVDDVIVENGAV